MKGEARAPRWPASVERSLVERGRGGEFFWVCVGSRRSEAKGEREPEAERVNENRSARDIPKVLIILSENLRKNLLAIGGKRW